MKRFGLTPLLILAAVATALLVGARFAPYFPGDLEATRFIQRVAPPGDWARALTRAAYAPWIYGVLAVSAIAAFRVAGWRGAAAMALTFFAFMHIEHPIKDAIARPRPSPQLLAEAGPAVAMAMGAPAPAAQPGFGMPSGWALLFGATVGVLGVLAWRHTRGIVRAAYLIGCSIVLLAGFAARVSLGAHWPSDVLAGYLLSVTTGLAVFEMLAAVKSPTSRALSRR